MITKLYKSQLPKWLKILIYVVLTLTLIYWLGLLIYKFLEYLRRFIHWASEKRNWWTFLFSVFLVLVGSFIMAQFVLGLDPWGKFVDWLNSIISLLELGG